MARQKTAQKRPKSKRKPVRKGVKAKKKRAKRVEPTAVGYAVHKEAARHRQFEMSREGRNIGEIPPVANPERRERCRLDLLAFCREYFPHVFYLPFCQDHLTIIRKIQAAILGDSRFAEAMPRGSGKSSILVVAVLWVGGYGHKRFVPFIGSDKKTAQERLQSVQAMVEDRSCAFFEDFPEICYPISCLDGISNRASGQLYHDKRTHVKWTTDEIVFPTIEGAPSSGFCIRVTGITGRIRGMTHTTADGVTRRPDLVILDDPQTRASAASRSQCVRRERTLAGDVLGMAGPGKKISAIMPCTVIYPGDMADNILDRGKHPEWSGERTKMVYAFPTNDSLWEDYNEARIRSLAEFEDIRLATEFYAANREALDEGAVVAWSERFAEGELSAIQHAMNLKFEDEEAFFAEYQNEPMLERSALELAILTPDQICEKLNGAARGEVPVGGTIISAFIDVGHKVLHWLVAAWQQDFTGYAIDYGIYPKQPTRYVVASDAKVTLADVGPAGGIEGAVYAGLDELTKQMLGREWMRQDGTAMRVEWLMIDASDGSMTDTIYQFCRQSAYASTVRPSHGRGVQAGQKPMNLWIKKPGEKSGGAMMWIERVGTRRVVRHVIYDTNFWKTFVHARLSVAMGNRGCLSLFGKKAMEHRMLADHLTAEKRDRVTSASMGRMVDQWITKPGQTENHFLDCLVGSAVGASIQGAALYADTGNQKKRVKYSEIQKRKRGRR